MHVEEAVVDVIVRFRPLLENELGYLPLSCVDVSNNHVTVYPPGTLSLTFSFDSVLDSIATQEQVYSRGPKAIIESVMQGFNGTIFAYGQVFSGKTYTMFGDQFDQEKMGIVPRMINTIFDSIDSTDESSEFLIKVSFCELYLEKVYDLLNPAVGDLKVKSLKQGVSIEGLREVYTTCDLDLHELIRVGMVNKTNKESLEPARFSASHTIFSISIKQTEANGVSRVGKLHFVDLAGSEKADSTAGMERAEQMKAINTSLTTLGIVINALTEKNTGFIPYRASKLTLILQEALGGNSKTALIITCSPSPANVEETMSSLRFATRVKNVKNYPIVNRESSFPEMKALFVQKLEQLSEVNRRITAMEARDGALRLELLRSSSNEAESCKDSVDYTEIKLEIDDLKQRTLEQQEIKKNTEQEIVYLSTTINLRRTRDDEEKASICVLEKKASELSTEMEDAESCFNYFLTNVSESSNELEEENRKIEALELNLAKILAEIEHSSCKLRCLSKAESNLTNPAVEEQLARRIREEKNKNQIQKDEIKKIQYEIDLLLFKKYKDYMEADDLQVTGKKIFELEMNIDKARMKFLEDEKQLTSAQRTEIRKREAIGKTVDNLSKDYRALTAKFSEKQLEKKVLEKKIQRLEEKVESLTADISRINKKQANTESLRPNIVRSSYFTAR